MRAAVDSSRCDRVFVARAEVNGLDPIVAVAGIELRPASQVVLVEPLSSGRHPAMAIREATTLDRLRGGGVGIGLLADEATDLRRLLEAIRVASAMASEPSPSFLGEFYRIDGAVNRPAPIAPEGLPTWVLLDGGCDLGRFDALESVADSFAGLVVIGEGEAPLSLRAHGLIGYRCERVSNGARMHPLLDAAH